MGHFTVAVQLIAKQIGDHNHLGPELGKDPAGCRLVALNDGVLLPAFAGKTAVHNELRGNAAYEIGSGAVGKIALTLLQKGLLHHAGTGGLAVCAGYGHGLYAFGDYGQKLRANLKGNAAGHGSAATVYKAGEAPEQLTYYYCYYGFQLHDFNSLSRKNVLYLQDLALQVLYRTDYAAVIKNFHQGPGELGTLSGSAGVEDGDTSNFLIERAVGMAEHSQPAALLLGGIDQ